MGKFFSRFKKDPPDPSVSSLGNLANFYSLLIFLIAIPFILIIALVWLTGVLGFSAWIFAGFAGLCAYIVWRLSRRWKDLKAKMAAQTGDFQDLMREATQSGKDVEISLMNGVFTLRYTGAHRLSPGHPPRGPAPAPGPGWSSHPGRRGRRTPRLAAAGTPPGGAGGVHPAPGRRRHQPRGIRPHQGQPAPADVRLNPLSSPARAANPIFPSKSLKNNIRWTYNI